MPDKEPSQDALYCANCGAANPATALLCFACAHDLRQQDEQEALLNERYRVLTLVGTGGYGAVYRAIDTRSADRIVAIKQINLRGLSAQQSIEATDAFNRELAILSGLSHPALPRIYDHFTDAEHWYLAMDFIEGETLERYVQPYQGRATGGLLPIYEVLSIGLQLCSVLEYLHTHQPPIIFRDLKPANIMRAAGGNLYLIDFGVARYVKPGQAKDTLPLGSPGYAAPEQYGRAQTSPRSDIYSLGALLHYLLSGDDPAESPFHFTAPRLYGEGMPQLKTLLARMVELDASKRPAQVGEVRQELERLAIALDHPGSRNLYTVSHPVMSMPGTTFNTAQGGQGTAGQQQQQQVVQPSVAYNLGRITRRAFTGGAIGATALFAIGGLYALSHIKFYNRMDARGSASAAQPAVVVAAGSPDGKHLAFGDDTGMIRVATINQTGSISEMLMYKGHVRMPYNQNESTITIIEWSHDGKWIASSGLDKTLQVWDAHNGEQRYVYKKYSQPISRAAWSPNGKFIAMTSSYQRMGQVVIWEPQSQRERVIDSLDRQNVTSLAWSPDGKRLALGEANGTVQIYDAQSNRHIFTYKGHTNVPPAQKPGYYDGGTFQYRSVTTLAWSPDGKQIASGGIDQTVQVWNAQTGAQRFRVYAHNAPVTDVEWSPDGKKLASLGSDGYMHVLRSDNGHVMTTLYLLFSNGNAVAWRPDSQHLTVAGPKMGIKVLDV